MLTYDYTAKNLKSGEMVKAEVQAESVMAASKLLREQNLFPISITDQSKGGLAGQISILNKVGLRNLVVFTRQLATLVNAGLPIVQSLRNVQNQISNKRLKSIISDVIASVEGGSSLSEALKKHPEVFNDVYVYLVKSGETSGTLDQVLDRLADQQEKDAAILRKVRGAMVYPIIVLVVVVAVVIFLLVTLLPQVASLYHDLGKNLPLLTRILVGLSQFVTRFWYIVAILALGGGIFLYQFSKTPRGQRMFDQLKLNAPVFGTLFEKVYMARFARTMSTLLSSGIPMLEGLDVTSKAVRNQLVQEAIQRASGLVKGGKNLSKALELEKATFLPLVPQMVAIGEASGATDEMLLKVAVFYEGDVDEAVKNLSTTIEPVMMVILGVIVGLVIAAVLLPIYGLVGSGGLSNIH